MTLGLIWWNYYDAINEGDGDRLLRIWKYLTIIFRETGHRNYAKEGALLLIQYHFMASERVSMQILTSRFINTKGRTGCNLPCDLHLEHLNRRLKGVLTRMESNVKPSSVTRAARAIGVVDEICRSFGNEMGRQDDSDKHRKPSYIKDYKLILDELDAIDIYKNIPNRKHKNIFLKKNILESVNVDKYTDWIVERIIPSFI